MEHVNTPLCDYHAVVFNPIACEPRDSGTLNADLYEPWGRTLAVLYNASQGSRDSRRPSKRDRLGLANPLLSSFVRGYRSARALEETDLGRLPLSMLMSNLPFYASLRIIVEEGREDSEPEWVKGLLRKLRGKIEKYHNELEQWTGRGFSRALAFL